MKLGVRKSLLTQIERHKARLEEEERATAKLKGFDPDSKVPQHTPQTLVLILVLRSQGASATAIGSTIMYVADTCCTIWVQ